MSHSSFIIRCRGIIVDQGKILVVKHSQDSGFYAFPGGHLEQGEDIRECMKREIKEELGIEPTLGNLLYVHNYSQGRENGDMIHSVEFFFEITNGKDFVKYADKERSHAHELAEIRWITKDENVNLLPKQIAADFRNDTLPTDVVRFT